MKIDMGDIKKKFQEKQYKLTPQRQVILQVFVEHQDEHLSAEDVHVFVRQYSSEIGLATVYRTLELFSELDVLQKMDFGDGRSRYEFNETSTPHHHHHLICLGCGQVKEFEDDLLETLEKTIARKSDFMIINHQVKFYGYCRECKGSHEE